MRKETIFRRALPGICAGSVTGLLGAGGGMVLVPLLSKCTDLTEDQIFPASLCIMLPICLTSLFTTAFASPLPWADATPYLLSGTVGGILAGFFGGRIPVVWLHRALGLIILWGGVRYLC